MPNTRRPVAVVVSSCAHVALSQGAQAVVESRPVVAYAGGEIVVEVHLVLVPTAYMILDDVGRTMRGARRGAGVG